DTRRAPEDARELVEDVPEDPDFVGAACSSSRQDHGDPALPVLLLEARHADSGAPVVLARGTGDAGAGEGDRSPSAQAVSGASGAAGGTMRGTGVVSKSAAFMGQLGKSLRRRGSRTVRMR